MFAWVSHAPSEVPEKPHMQWVIRVGGISVGWLELETSFMVLSPDVSLKGRQELVTRMGGGGHCGRANSTGMDRSRSVRGLTRSAWMVQEGGIDSTAIAI